MQGTWVRSLAREDPTCLRATKPVHHNYWAHSPQLLKATHPRACAPWQEKPQQWEAHTPQGTVAPAHRNYRKPALSNEDPTQPKQTNKQKQNKLNYLLWPGNEFIWLKLLKVQNGLQWSVPSLTPVPRDSKCYLSLMYPSREILWIHRQGSVFSSLLPQQFSVPLPFCILEIIPRVHFYFLQLYSVALNWWICCFQLFATLNRVALDNLEWYTWASNLENKFLKAALWFW